MGTGSFPGVNSGRSMTLTSHTLLVLWSEKSRAIPLLPLWAVRPVQSLSTCTRVHFNPLTPNDHSSGLTALLTSKRCFLYIYSTNIDTEYFKHGIYSTGFSLQNAVSFIILTHSVPVLFTFYLQDVLKLKKNNSGAKRLTFSFPLHIGCRSSIRNFSIAMPG